MLDFCVIFYNPQTLVGKLNFKGSGFYFLAPKLSPDHKSRVFRHSGFRNRKKSAISVIVEDWIITRDCFMTNILLFNHQCTSIPVVTGQNTLLE